MEEEGCDGREDVGGGAPLGSGLRIRRGGLREGRRPPSSLDDAGDKVCERRNREDGARRKMTCKDL